LGLGTCDPSAPMDPPLSWTPSERQMWPYKKESSAGPNRFRQVQLLSYKLDLQVSSTMPVYACYANNNNYACNLECVIFKNHLDC